MAVLAFPVTADAARVADLDEKSLVYRAPYSSSQPPIKPYLPAPADYAQLPADQCIARDQIVDLTARWTLKAIWSGMFLLAAGP